MHAYRVKLKKSFYCCSCLIPARQEFTACRAHFTDDKAFRMYFPMCSPLLMEKTVFPFSHNIWMHCAARTEDQLWNGEKFHSFIYYCFGGVTVARLGWKKKQNKKKPFIQQWPQELRGAKSEDSSCIWH